MLHNATQLNTAASGAMMTIQHQQQQPNTHHYVTTGKKDGKGPSKSTKRHVNLIHAGNSISNSNFIRSSSNTKDQIEIRHNTFKRPIRHSQPVGNIPHIAKDDLINGKRGSFDGGNLQDMI